MITLTERLTSLFIPFAITSVMGMASYFFVGYANRRANDFVDNFSFPCALLIFILVLPLIFVSTIFFLPVGLGMLATLALSVGSAYADRAIEEEKDTWLWHFWKIWMAVVISVIGSLFCLYLLDWLTGTMRDSIALAMGLMGLFVGPIATPIFLWFFQNSVLRPGMDRHLNPTDEISSR